jgi:hypothetical protein
LGPPVLVLLIVNLARAIPTQQEGGCLGLSQGGGPVRIMLGGGGDLSPGFVVEDFWLAEWLRWRNDRAGRICSS